jgi:hypothetical protein
MPLPHSDKNLAKIQFPVSAQNDFNVCRKGRLVMDDLSLIFMNYTFDLQWHSIGITT